MALTISPAPAKPVLPGHGYGRCPRIPARKYCRAWVQSRGRDGGPGGNGHTAPGCQRRSVAAARAAMPWYSTAQGGSGNTGGTVTLDNSGLITTAGDFAIGVMAQSVGGGGGTGGDSTAASYAKGPQDSVSISISVAVGGSGGTGGIGGAVNITNE